MARYTAASAMASRAAEQQSSRARAVQWPVQEEGLPAASGLLLDNCGHSPSRSAESLASDEMSLYCQLPWLPIYDADLMVFFPSCILVHPVAPSLLKSLLL